MIELFHEHPAVAVAVSMGGDERGTYCLCLIVLAADSKDCHIDAAMAKVASKIGVRRTSISVATLGASGPLAFEPADCLFLLLPALVGWFCVELLVFKGPDDTLTLAHAFETLQTLFQTFVFIDEYFCHDSSTMLFQHPETVQARIESG